MYVIATYTKNPTHDSVVLKCSLPSGVPPSSIEALAKSSNDSGVNSSLKPISLDIHQILDFTFSQRSFVTPFRTTIPSEDTVVPAQAPGVWLGILLFLAASCKPKKANPFAILLLHNQASSSVGDMIRTSSTYCATSDATNPSLQIF